MKKKTCLWLIFACLQQKKRIFAAKWGANSYKTHY